MTDEIVDHLEQFETWAQKKFGGRPPCPLCHSTDMRITFRPHSLRSTVECRRCAHVTIFDSEATGILPPLPE